MSTVVQSTATDKSYLRVIIDGARVMGAPGNYYVDISVGGSSVGRTPIKWGTKSPTWTQEQGEFLLCLPKCNLSHLSKQATASQNVQNTQVKVTAPLPEIQVSLKRWNRAPLPDENMGIYKVDPMTAPVVQGHAAAPDITCQALQNSAGLRIRAQGRRVLSNVKKSVAARLAPQAAPQPAADTSTARETSTSTTSTTTTSRLGKLGSRFHDKKEALKDRKDALKEKVVERLADHHETNVSTASSRRLDSDGEEEEEEEEEIQEMQGTVEAQVNMIAYWEADWTTYRSATTVAELEVEVHEVKLRVDGPPGRAPQTSPYVVVQYGNAWSKTCTARHTAALSFSPPLAWAWPVTELSDVLVVCVFDEPMVPNKAHPLLGKVRVRLNTVRPNVAGMHTFDLVVPKRRAKLNGTITMQLHVKPSNWIDVAKRYLKPALAPCHYLRPLSPMATRCLFDTKRTVMQHEFEHVYPKSVIEAVVDAPYSPFAVRKAKANMHRLKGAASPSLCLKKFLGHVESWDNGLLSATFIVLWVFFAYNSHLILPAVFLYLAGLSVRGLRRRWAENFKLIGMNPEHFGVPPPSTQHNTDEETDGGEEEEEKEKEPSSKQPVMTGEVFEYIQTTATSLQATVGDVAGVGERVQAIFHWEDVYASSVCLAAFLVIALLLLLVPLRHIVAFAGCFLFRHPITRDPLPPPPKNVVFRAPTIADHMM